MRSASSIRQEKEKEKDADSNDSILFFPGFELTEDENLENIYSKLKEELSKKNANELMECSQVYTIKNGLQCLFPPSFLIEDNLYFFFPSPFLIEDKLYNECLRAMLDGDDNDYVKVNDNIFVPSLKAILNLNPERNKNLLDNFDKSKTMWIEKYNRNINTPLNINTLLYYTSIESLKEEKDKKNLYFLTYKNAESSPSAENLRLYYIDNNSKKKLIEGKDLNEIYQATKGRNLTYLDKNVLNKLDLAGTSDYAQLDKLDSTYTEARGREDNKPYKFFQFFGWNNTLAWQAEAEKIRRDSYHSFMEFLKQKSNSVQIQLIEHALTLDVFNEHRSNYLRNHETTFVVTLLNEKLTELKVINSPTQTRNRAGLVIR